LRCAPFQTTIHDGRNKELAGTAELAPSTGPKTQRRLMTAEASFLLEIVFDSEDLDAAFGGRDEIEDPLHEALVAAGVGAVTGGGGMGKSHLDAEVTDRDAGLALVRQLLRDLNVPGSTIVYVHEGDLREGTGTFTSYPVYEQP
jgi:hypothetical protein